jgi:hypothetical protein
MNLADFDPDIVAAYHITERDLQNVVRHITILQGRESQVLNDLAAGGYYGTRGRQLSIENAEEAFGDYADRYRLLPEIYVAEGDSFNDIVANLERFLGYKRPEGLRRELAVLTESGQEYRLD